MFSNKAFTLLELLVVITIIGILSSIVIVSMSGSTDSASIAKGKAYAQQVHALLGHEVVLDLNFNENAQDTCPDGKDVCDASGYNNNGTISGATYVSSPIDGYALSFDGVNNYVNCGASVAQLTGDLTITWWQKRTITKYDSQPWGTQTGLSDITAPYHAFMYTSASINFYVANGTETFRSSGWSPLLMDTWIFFAARISGNEIRLFKDGVSDTPGTFEGSRITGNVFTIGAWATTGGRNFGGSIDDVRVYTAALSSTEIQKHYAQGLGKLLVNQAITQAEYDQRMTEFNQSLVLYEQ